MAYTKAGMRAVNKYIKTNYDEIKVRVPKGRRKTIEAFAKKHGQSVNGLVNELLRSNIGLTEAQWNEKSTDDEE